MAKQTNEGDVINYLIQRDKKTKEAFKQRDLDSRGYVNPLE